MPNVADIAGALAAQVIQERLDAGGALHIPSLGLTIGGDSALRDLESRVAAIADRSRAFQHARIVARLTWPWAVFDDRGVA